MLLGLDKRSKMEELKIAPWRLRCRGSSIYENVSAADECRTGVSKKNFLLIDPVIRKEDKRE